MSGAYTDDEIQAICETWHSAPDIAQVAVDLATERGEAWAAEKLIHYDLTHQHWRTQAGTDTTGDHSALNYAALKWAHDHLHPDLYRRGHSRAFPELIEDVLTFVKANPRELAQGIWGVRERQLLRHQSASAQMHGRPNSMTQHHLVGRLRYHMRRLPLGHDSGWWGILVGCETAVTAPWATCWPHVFQAVADPRFNPHQTPESRARKTHSLIATVGKVAAENLKPPTIYGTWQAVLDGRRDPAPARGARSVPEYFSDSNVVREIQQESLTLEAVLNEQAAPDISAMLRRLDASVTASMGLPLRHVR